MPALARCSTSDTVAQAMPAAPAASCLLAISTDLCVLACGRSATPLLAASRAMAVMLRFMASISTTSAGVLTVSKQELSGASFAIDADPRGHGLPVAPGRVQLRSIE